MSYRRRDCAVILICHCEFTTVNVAILMYSDTYEIASVTTLPRKDIATQSLHRNDELGITSL